MEQLKGAVRLWVQCEESLGSVSLDEMGWVDPEEWLARLFDVDPEEVRRELVAERARVAPEVKAKREREEREDAAWREQRAEEQRQRAAERDAVRREKAKKHPFYETIEESKARWAKEREEE